MNTIDLRRAAKILAAVLAAALVAFVAAVGVSAVSPEEAQAKTTVKEHREALMTEAKRHLGTKYVYGGTSVCKVNVSMDCACFTRVVYARAAGYKLPDHVVKQRDYAKKHGRWVNRKDLRQGDLLFFDENRNGKLEPWDHVALYAGGGNIMHASHYFGQVVVTPINYMKGFKNGGYRFPPR